MPRFGDGWHRTRKTVKGALIRTMPQLAAALESEGAVLYLRGKHQPKAVLRSMTYHTLALFVRAGGLNLAVYPPKEKP